MRDTKTMNTCLFSIDFKKISACSKDSWYCSSKSASVMIWFIHGEANSLLGAFFNINQLHVDCSTRFFTNFDHFWFLLESATGYSRISAPSPSGNLTTWKFLANHYLERLAKAFILDALSIFYHVRKVRCFPWCIILSTCSNKTKHFGMVLFPFCLLLLQTLPLVLLHPTVKPSPTFKNTSWL